MAVDYNRTRQTVERMINTYGRLITLEQEVGPGDPTKPLKGAGPSVKIPDVMGVFVRPSGYIKLGESFYLDPGMWEEAEKIVLVLPSLTHDYAKFTRVIDGDGKGYKIFKTEELKPGNVPLLIYLGLRL